MRLRVDALAVVALIGMLAGCGGEDTSSGATSQVSSSPSSSPTVASTSAEPTAETEPPEPSFGQMSEKQLRHILLTIDALPPGYSADPPDDGASVAGYCGYAPERAPTKVGQDFTRGGGFSTELASVGLSQYPSAAVASRNLENLREGLRTCKGESLQGDDVQYSVMSTPKLNYPTLGIRVEADNYTVLLNIAQVGPTVVVSGTGGLTTADADLAAQLLVQQVKIYASQALH
jgi:hypothetical protein